MVETVTTRHGLFGDPTNENFLERKSKERHISLRTTNSSMQFKTTKENLPLIIIILEFYLADESYYTETQGSYSPPFCFVYDENVKTLIKLSTGIHMGKKVYIPLKKTEVLIKGLFFLQWKTCVGINQQKTTRELWFEPYFLMTITFYLTPLYQIQLQTTTTKTSSRQS